jgi:hypothetical protein
VRIAKQQEEGAEQAAASTTMGKEQGHARKLGSGVIVR